MTNEIDRKIAIQEQILALLTSDTVEISARLPKKIDDTVVKKNKPVITRGTRGGRANPEIINQNILIALMANQSGLANAEIRAFLKKDKNVSVSKGGIAAGLKRLLEKGAIKRIPSKDKLYKRYVLV